MRRRISLLVAATTSAVVLAFVIPLLLLVRSVASDRALSVGDDEARSAGIVVSRLSGTPGLADAVEEVDLRSAATTSVITPDGEVLGSPAPDIVTDGDLARGRDGQAFTDLHDGAGEIVVPVVTDQGPFVVVTVVPESMMTAGVGRAWLSISLLGVALLGAAVVVADRIGRRTSRPVTRLADVAERLGEGDLGARADPEGPPETVELADTMNRMAARIEELLVAERSAVGDLSHRLRTPVTALRLDAESLPDPALAARLGSHIEQLQASIDALVREARRPLGDTLQAGCDARAVVSGRAAYWSALAEDQGREVELDLPREAVGCAVNAADLVDVVDVLVDNVFAHTPAEVGFRISLVEQPDTLTLEVSDPGPALPDDPQRVGSTGLGLDIVRRSAAQAGGHLTWTQDDSGTHARVVLPRLVPPPGSDRGSRHRHGGHLRP